MTVARKDRPIERAPMYVVIIESDGGSAVRRSFASFDEAQDFANDLPDEIDVTILAAVWDPEAKDYKYV